MQALLPYFAYGSNMASRQLAERCPGAVPLGPARLPGYALAFDRWSERRGGYVADIIPAPGAETWGVLWVVTAHHLEALDRFEGVAHGAYQREAVLAFQPGAAGPTEAVAYRACTPGQPGAPTPAYLALILEGAREHGLPAAYVASLEALARFGGTPGTR